MSRLPDNFSQAAFDIQYAVAPAPLGRDAEQIGQLEAIADKIRDLIGLLIGADTFPDLVEHARDCLRDIPLTIARIEHAARFDREAA